MCTGLSPCHLEWPLALEHHCTACQAPNTTRTQPYKHNSRDTPRFLNPPLHLLSYPQRALEAGQVAQAALDVFADEPPKFEGHPLIGRPDVICTPHLGASTTEAQEGVAIEVVEAVVDALMGKLSANAVNAPMVPMEILKELQPFITLAEGLGKAAVSLVADG